MIKKFLLGLSLCFGSLVYSQFPDTILNWHPESKFECGLYFYKTRIKKEGAPSVLICPGGGYSHLATDHEGLMIAKWFNSIGINAFVLEYTTNGILKKDEGINPAPLKQALAAMAYIRKNSLKYGCDSSKIGIMGFSAGGHLASSVLVHYDYYEYYNISSRPDFGILGYPVISFADSITHKGSRRNLIGKNPSKKDIEFFSNELHINENTPPTLLFHSTDDNVVPAENSLLFYSGLLKNNNKSALHIFSKGGHGYGFYENNPEIAEIKDIIKSWLKDLKIL